MATSGVIRLKLVIDTKEKRVLFGEANNDCVKFLTRILSLPVSKVAGLLGKQETTVANLYETLVNPQPIKCSSCGRYCSCVTMAAHQRLQQQQQVVSSSEGVTALVFDDLVVKPMSSMSSCISLLNEFNVKDLGSLQEKVVDLGIDEAVKLLKAYLETKNVLTQVFLKDLGSPAAASQDKKPVVGKRRRQPDVGTLEEEVQPRGGCAPTSSISSTNGLIIKGGNS